MTSADKARLLRENAAKFRRLAGRKSAPEYVQWMRKAHAADDRARELEGLTP